MRLMKSMHLSVCLFLLFSGLTLSLGAQSEVPPPKPFEGQNTAKQAGGNLKDPDRQKRNIRFQFEGVPYADALQRFSQMADKPLIAETPIEGTLTFFDSEPYTYIEPFRLNKSA